MKTPRFSRLAGAVLAAFVLGAPAAAQVPVILEGTVRWTDTTGIPHPVRFAHVEAVNLRTGRVMGAPDTTDALGTFRIAVPPAPDRMFVRVFARTADTRVQQMKDKRDYTFDGSAVSGSAASPPMDITLRLRTPENAAFSILDALTYGRQYAAGLDPKPPEPVIARYPATQNVYDRSGRIIRVKGGDHMDWDVVLHEYGHHTANQLGVEVSPGGTHKPAWNLARGSKDPESALLLAWSEGLATFFSISSQRALALSGLGIPRVDDGRYTDLGNAGQDYAVNGTDAYSRLGQDNTVAVARILYDLYDSPGDGADDAVWLCDAALWQQLRAGNVQVLTAAWAALRHNAAPLEAAQIGGVFEVHGAAPLLVWPTPNFLVGEAPPEFSWEPPTGFPLHDRFALEVLDRDGVPVWRSPEIPETRYTPPDTVWQVVRTANAPLSWTVHAWRADAPALAYMSGARGLQSPESAMPPLPDAPKPAIKPGACSAGVLLK